MWWGQLPAEAKNNTMSESSEKLTIKLQKAAADSGDDETKAGALLSI